MHRRGLLKCPVLLDHGRLLVVPISEHAAHGVQQVRHFMASHQDELCAAHMNFNPAMAEWARPKEDMVKHLANVQMSKMWQPLAP